MQSTIPSLDLNDFLIGPKVNKLLFVENLGHAFNEVGFVAVKNHGLTDKLTQQLYKCFREFFQLPDEIKSKYDIPGLAGQRGYTGKRKENAKGSKVADLKEFYHVGQFQKPAEPELVKEYPDNVWPIEVPEMEEVALEAFRILESAGLTLLKAIALYLNLDENYFDNKVKNGNSILRAIHYFPIENKEDIDSNAVRAGAHEDINLITLLMGASAEGLEILNNQGVWIPVTALPDQIVVNVGDMLSRLTNDKLKSTTHRVVNPSKEKLHEPRYSIPFFMHPRADMDLTCLTGCIDSASPKKYPDITAGAFLHQRLREIGLS